MQILAQPDAELTARRLMPIIEFGVEMPWDWPTKFGEGIDNNDMRPVIYYRSMRDDGNEYLLGAMYSRRDYTKCVFADALGLGEHWHDCEGFLIMRGKMSVSDFHHWQKITVAHHNLVLGYGGFGDKCALWRESRSHAIYPDWKYLHNPVTITDPHLINIDHDLTPRQIEDWRAEFKPHGVNLWDDWSHRGKYKGWMATRPADLFKEMRK